MEAPEYRQYVYIFTRQDISPEQQLVQSAHVALKLGYLCAKNDRVFLDPDDTYFTVVGVRNLAGLEAVEEILRQFDRSFVRFIEPDIGNEITSIAVGPIPEGLRNELLAFSWLKF